MRTPGILFCLGSLVLLAVRMLSPGLEPGWWGLDYHKFLAPTALYFHLAGFFLLLSASLLPERFFASEPATWSRRTPWLAAISFLIIASFLPPAANPLLGDGVDRLLALPAGLAGLKAQPAPLDILVHLGAFKLFASFGISISRAELLSYQATSYLAGAAAVFFVFKLADARGSSRMEKAFIAAGLLFTGSFLLFLGYVENYSLLVGACSGFLYLLDRVEKGKARFWHLWPAFLFLVALHFFMILLLPGLLWSLRRHRSFRPGWKAAALGGILLLAFAAFAGFLVAKHYRGLAIFVSPSKWFSWYHLSGFLNQEILASPSWPLLAAAAFWGDPGKNEKGLLMDFLAVASLFLVGFFFFLRPVIGPAADWDLFSLPAVFYTAWLVFRSVERRGKARAFHRFSFSALAISVFSCFTWVSVNAREEASIRRFQELMEQEAGFNRWAASYGYYRLGKYLAVMKARPDRERARQALNKALEVNPASAILHAQCAEVFYAMGDLNRARELMVKHHLLRAEEAEKNGDWKTAESQYQKALALNHDSRPALKGLLRLYEGPLNNPETAARLKERLRAGEAQENRKK